MKTLSGTRVKPMLMVVFINIIGFFLLYFYYKAEIFSVVECGAALCAINIAVYFIMSRFELGDVYMFLMVSMLVSIGCIMLFRIDADKGKNQVIWFCIGVGVFFVSYFVYRIFKKWNMLTYFYMALSFALFVVTLVFARAVAGSRNWIMIGKLSVQPSEFIKVLYAFTMACFYSKKESSVAKLNKKLLGVSYKDWLLFCYVYICLGFLVLQREWGTAVLFMLVYFTMQLLYDANIRLIILNTVLAVLGSVGGYFLTPHIKVRVSTWLDPWADATNKGYQIVQSLTAIASGGYFGTGIGNGDPYFIPEVHSDFIFSAICEEMGMFIGVAIIMLYFIFSYRGFKIALKTHNEFNKALSVALVSCFAYQTFIIVGGVIKMIPLTGITLPFVSYGGSSMVSSFIMLGILTSISHNA